MIRVRSLRQDSPGSPRALDGVDLDIARGEFCGSDRPERGGENGDRRLG